jgi:tryptophan-rich sensory protein
MEYYPPEEYQTQPQFQPSELQKQEPPFGSSQSQSFGEDYGSDFTPVQESGRIESESGFKSEKLRAEEQSDIHSHTSALQLSKRFVLIFVITVIIVFGLGFLLSALYPANARKPWFLKVRNEKTGEIDNVKIDIPFYEIVRPDGAPNDEVFRVVWPMIFLLLSISTAITLNQEKRDSKYYFIIFLILAQFALIFAWIPVFNKEHKPRSALYILVSLVMLGSFTAVLIAGVNIYAGAIWAIFVAWLYYALNLNINSVTKYERFVESFLKKYVPILPPPVIPNIQQARREAAIQQASQQAQSEMAGGDKKIDLPPL